VSAGASRLTCAARSVCIHHSPRFAWMGAERRGEEAHSGRQACLLGGSRCVPSSLEGSQAAPSTPEPAQEPALGGTRTASGFLGGLPLACSARTHARALARTHSHAHKTHMHAPKTHTHAHTCRNGHSESRRSRRLVISFISTVVNYEYGFYFYLYQVGTLERTHTHTHTHMHMHTHMHIQTHAQTRTHMHAHIHIHPPGRDAGVPVEADRRAVHGACWCRALLPASLCPPVLPSCPPLLSALQPCPLPPPPPAACTQNVLSPGEEFGEYGECAIGSPLLTWKCLNVYVCSTLGE